MKCVISYETRPDGLMTDASSALFLEKLLRAVKNGLDREGDSSDSSSDGSVFSTPKRQGNKDGRYAKEKITLIKSLSLSYNKIMFVRSANEDDDSMSEGSVLATVVAKQASKKREIKGNRASKIAA
jgi:hypothetical protein